MKFLYGKQDWKTFERGEETCYLMTNGLGGFSSLSIIGSCSRNDQAVLMVCLHSPNRRFNMIHRLEETLTLGDRRIMLSSQDYQCHEKRECGYLYQSSFVYEDYPCWTYLADGVEVIRTIALMHGKNAVGITYEINNRSAENVTLDVLPHMQFMPKGARLPRNQEFTFMLKEEPGEKEAGKAAARISSCNRHLHLCTNGTLSELPLRFCETLYYSDDVKDGKMELGRSAVNHKISCFAAAGEKTVLEIVYGTDAVLPRAEEIAQNLAAYRQSWRNKAGFDSPAARALCAAASQFVSYRTSTTKQTILAGFPFFEDWGRDTMIAVVGCCLSTKQFRTAEEILRTFMIYCRKGLMPNLFPEGGAAPGYNTADASLLFIIAVYEYYRRTGDSVFVDSAYPVMADIVDWYERGTDYEIHMDEDGLITAGSGMDQVTWMDVRVGDILPTPRHGKPVEINAYWYNALRIMDEFKQFSPQNKKNYGEMAERVLESFNSQFWNEDAGCLKDVLSGTKADTQIRCNQIWAVSLPFSLLPRKKEKQVVETVFRRLYTPYGLRTLDPADEEFRSFYGGAQLDRDLAYHQGTVWTYLLGGYYLAYLKVNDYSEEAKDYVRRQLESVEAALREGCVGQLPEIYDGGNPVSSKGCFAQAWSVGELLRVYECVQ